MEAQEIIKEVNKGKNIILSSEELTDNIIEDLFSSRYVNIFCCSDKYIITTKNLTEEQIKALLRGDNN